MLSIPIALIVLCTSGFAQSADPKLLDHPQAMLGISVDVHAGPDIRPTYGETAFYGGTINSRFVVVLTITWNGNNLSGSYQYATQHKLLDLKGKLLPDGALRIIEYSSPNVATGEFFLKGASGQSQLNGEWRSANGKRSYKVHLERLDQDPEEYDPTVESYEDPEVFRLSGEYFIHLMLLCSGTAYLHRDSFVWVAPDGTLHGVKFAAPAVQYRGLREGESVWKGEVNVFLDDDATFRFGIWREGDANGDPSGGQVIGRYKLIGDKHYDFATKKWSTDFQIVPADFKRLSSEH
jgi:hypothetical protein